MPRQPSASLESQLKRNPYLIWFAVILVGLVVWAVLVPLPKRGVKNVIMKGRRAIEALDVNALEPMLADKFEAPRTGDREETIEKLRDTFGELLSIQIKIKRTRIRIQDQSAVALVDFYVSGVFRGGDIYAQVPFRGLSGEPTLANPLERCRLSFVKESDGGWKITGAELLKATPQEVP